jgi:hypothetical protein
MTLVFEKNANFLQKIAKNRRQIVIITSTPGVNPTIASYNASVVNFYNATGSLALLENKNILFLFEKRCRLLQRWRCSCKLKKRL